MRTHRLWAVGVVAAMAAAGQAAPDARTSGGTLLETADARVTGLSGAATTLTGDVGSAAANPAALSTLRGGQVSTQFQSALGEVKTQFLSYGAGNGRAGWGATVLYLDAGSLDVVTLGGSTTTRRAQQDLAGALSGGIALGDNLRLGLSAKALSSTLVESHHAFTWAGDAGLQMDLPNGWALGLAVLNAGPSLTYRTEGDPLPTTYHAGVSYHMTRGSQGTAGSVPWYAATKSTRNDITLAADTSLDRYGGVAGALGLEWDYDHRAIFRAGGSIDEENFGFSAGAGFWLKGWRFDYSFQSVEALPDRHRVTVSWFTSGSPK